MAEEEEGGDNERSKGQIIRANAHQRQVVAGRVVTRPLLFY
jgi:hypothetical protein